MTTEGHRTNPSFQVGQAGGSIIRSTEDDVVMTNQGRHGTAMALANGGTWALLST